MLLVFEGGLTTVIIIFVCVYSVHFFIFLTGPSFSLYPGNQSELGEDDSEAKGG